MQQIKANSNNFMYFCTHKSNNRHSMKRFLTIIICALAIVFQAHAYDVKMGVLLPFSGSEARTSKMVEFYRGVLMAVDSITAERNIKVEVVALDCGMTVAQIESLLYTHTELADCDFIIGPQSVEQLPILSAYCHERCIRLVVPFTLVNRPLDNEMLYCVSYDKSGCNTTAVNLFTALFHDCNFLCLKVEGAEPPLFKALMSELAANGFSVKTSSADADVSQLKSLLSPDKKTVILTNAQSLTDVNKVYSALHAALEGTEGYDISVMGDYDWHNHTHQCLSNYYRYDTFIPVTFFHNALSRNNVVFDKKYMRHFGVPMLATTPRFAPMGFDVAWFFLNALHTYGKEGTSVEESIYDVYLSQHSPLQHSLLFKMSGLGGWINQSCRFVHYSPNNSIELLTR